MNEYPNENLLVLKLAYDRNFPRDQLFCDVGKLRCNKSSFCGHIIVICLLGLLRKLNQTKSPKTFENLSKNLSMSNFYKKKQFVKSIQAGWDGVKIRFGCKIAGHVSWKVLIISAL